MTARTTHRGVAALTAAGFALLGAMTPASAVAAAPGTHPPRASAALVTLGADRVARRGPRSSARPITTIADRRPLTHARTVLPVLATRTGADGARWLRVRLPGRPNGRTGWITDTDTTRSSTSWHLTVRLAARTVEVHDAGRLVRRFRAVVGAPSTPTPRGRSFVEEAVALDRRAEGGPFALATGARSTVLQEFNGGPGQIALHGMQGLGDELGTAASHGCVRLSDAAITWLARRIGPGTPIMTR